jgi:hypothetical protein
MQLNRMKLKIPIKRSNGLSNEPMMPESVKLNSFNPKSEYYLSVSIFSNSTQLAAPILTINPAYVIFPKKCR